MITIHQVVEAAPADVRETLDDGTVAYLSTVIEGKTDPDDVRKALTPFLGMSSRDLDAMFARLSLGTSTPVLAAGPSDLLAEVAKQPSSPSKKDRKLKRSPKPPAGPSVMAYSQQSRFHSATLQTLSTEIDLRGVNITVDDAELLVDARLWLKSGVHYGLVGRNGAGKSTLLSVLGDHSLVGFPENIRTLYVQQLDVMETDDSVLSAVLSADEERAKRVKDAEAIEAAVAANDLDGIKDALATYIRRIADERILAAQKIATLRSGARGKKARGVALKAEQGMKTQVHEEVYGLGEGEAQVAAKVLATLYGELEEMDADSAEARARAILAGLDIDEEMQDSPVSRLSGGWRMRVALAKAMFVRPDLLLLDECTNHLDLAAIAWLQSYLQTLDVTIVCVSHDRDFLNGVSQEIIRLKDRTLSYHPGNYDEYEQSEEELAKKKARQYESLQRRREHVQKSIERFTKHARSSNDDKVLGQVASRQKKLERMSGMEKTEDGKRFKVSYWAGYHDTMRPEIELKKAETAVDLKIPNPESLRGSGPLVSLSSVSFAYPGRKRRVIKSVSLSIMPGDHLALLGLNGCGKSTLVGLLAGTLAPTHGTVTRHPGLRVGHYTQHFVDELSSVRVSALELLRTKAAKQAEEALARGLDAATPKEGDLRKWLGGFEISGPLALRPVNTMSGGQRARLAMAIMLYDRPNLLLLDEITNHLDMYAVQGLVAAINDYEGTVVLVTHDRHFVRETADDVYALEDGRIRLLEEGIDEYVSQFEE